MRLEPRRATKAQDKPRAEVCRILLDPIIGPTQSRPRANAGSPGRARRTDLRTNDLAGDDYFYPAILLPTRSRLV